MKIFAIQKRAISVFLHLVAFLMGIGIDLYVPSLPAIADYFNATSHAVQITIGIYMFGYAIGQLFLGILSDSFGRRKIIILSGFFYTLASLLAAFSPNIFLLITYRFLQGLSISGLGVVARAVATDMFDGLDLAKSLASFSLSWAIGPILGPFIGGYIQHYFDWKTNFYVFGVYGLIVFVFTVFALPETCVNRVPFNPRKILGTIKIMLCNPVLFLAAFITSLTYSVLVIFNVAGPFLVQDVLHYSAVDYGRAALFLGLGYFSGASFNRYIINFIKPLKAALVALISNIVLSLLMLALSVFFQINLWIILLPVFAMFFFCGLIVPNMISSTVTLYKQSGGTVNAVFGSLTASGAFLMISIASLFKAQSQVPMAILYAAIAVLSLFLFAIIQKVRKH